MKRSKPFFWLGSPFAILPLGGFIHGCCGMGSGPSVPQVQQWMSEIHEGDPADKAVAVIKSRGFKIVDNRLTPEAAQRVRERGADVSDPYYHSIYASRLTDICVFTAISKEVHVAVQLNVNDRVNGVTVESSADGP